MAAFLANCLHGLEALGPGGLWAVMGALFLAGLAGGASHCAAMCGPFVLAQAAAMADRTAIGGMLQRLSGAALAPYHLGRVLGYGVLGALAGGVIGAISLGTGWRVVLAGGRLWRTGFGPCRRATGAGGSTSVASATCSTGPNSLPPLPLLFGDMLDW